ncbi:MAG: hypothetical protein ACREO1_03265 [Arenimonas sp.]
MKSFTTVVGKIHKNLIDTFEKAADAAIKGEADAEQTFRDFEKACKDTGSKSTDAARDEVKKHLTKSWMDKGISKADAEAMFGAKWKSVKDLGDKVMKSAPKVEAAAKSSWLEFVGVVSAIFAAAMVYVYSQTPSGPSPDQKAAMDIIHNSQQTQEQIERLNQIAISEAEFHIMLGGLEVQHVPTPADPVVAVTALPTPIAVVAAIPVSVQVVTPTATRTFETTFGEVYVNAPPPVQQYMVDNPPETYDNEETEDTEESESVEEPYPTSERHKTFTVSGTPFGSATFSY